MKKRNFLATIIKAIALSPLAPLLSESKSVAGQDKLGYCHQSKTWHFPDCIITTEGEMKASYLAAHFSQQGIQKQVIAIAAGTCPERAAQAASAFIRLPCAFFWGFFSSSFLTLSDKEINQLVAASVTAASVTAANIAEIT